MGTKRKIDTIVDSKFQNMSLPPYISSFESFREELDIHHDRRERVIKASRDITAASKKMYKFLLDRSWTALSFALEFLLYRGRRDQVLGRS